MPQESQSFSDYEKFMLVVLSDGLVYTSGPYDTKEEAMEIGQEYYDSESDVEIRIVNVPVQ